MNKNIKRFCQVVNYLNMLHTDLDKKLDDFYDGGKSFEEVYQLEIKEVEVLEEEFIVLLKEINK